MPFDLADITPEVVALVGIAALLLICAMVAFVVLIVKKRR